MVAFVSVTVINGLSWTPSTNEQFGASIHEIATNVAKYVSVDQFLTITAAFLAVVITGYVAVAFPASVDNGQRLFLARVARILAVLWLPSLMLVVGHCVVEHRYFQLSLVVTIAAVLLILVSNLGRFQLGELADRLKSARRDFELSRKEASRVSARYEPLLRQRQREHFEEGRKFNDSEIGAAVLFFRWLGSLLMRILFAVAVRGVVLTLAITMLVVVTSNGLSFVHSLIVSSRLALHLLVWIMLPLLVSGLFIPLQGEVISRAGRIIIRAMSGAVSLMSVWVGLFMVTAWIAGYAKVIDLPEWVAGVGGSVNAVLATFVLWGGLIRSPFWLRSLTLEPLVAWAIVAGAVRREREAYRRFRVLQAALDQSEQSERRPRLIMLGEA